MRTGGDHPEAGGAAEGSWEERAVVEEMRAGPYVQTWEELGYEVRLEPTEPPARQPECSECFAEGVSWVRVLVRQPG